MTCHRGVHRLYCPAVPALVSGSAAEDGVQSGMGMVMRPWVERVEKVQGDVVRIG